MARPTPLTIEDHEIKPGEFAELNIKVSEFHTATNVMIPVFVKRGMEDGPRLFVTAAVHGDEINGVQIVRNLVLELKEKEIKGTFIGVPVVNRFGFISHDRYMPDRRDLNRSFPGDPHGSPAARYADQIIKDIVSKCTHGIDLHTAGEERTNLPQVRADTTKAVARRMAKAFGTQVIISNRGRRGTLRRAASELGIPTIVFEAGETFRFQRDVVLAGKRGVMNVMMELGMLEGKPVKPEFQVTAKTSQWARAPRGGLLDVYVRPGDLVYEGDEIAVITSPFGKEVGVVKSPLTGLVIGRTMLPLVNPGSPICHVVRLAKTLARAEKFHAHRTGPASVPLDLSIPGAPH